MPHITTELILKALKDVKDPELNETLVKLGMIKNIEIKEKNISFDLMLTTIACPLKDFIKEECITVLKKHIDGIQDINIRFGEQPLQRQQKKIPNIDSTLIQGIKHIILVASGKGGVGKTTVSVNLALAIQKLGGKVGILDTDIYGPNIPSMLGVSSQQPKINQDGEKEIITPIEVEGIKVISMQYFIQDEQPVLWRGPMLNSIIQQFLFQSDWGHLDYLIIDTPPGTGDIQLSLHQMLNIDGVVLVTTAQVASLLDVKRSITQFNEFKIPVLGVVENMSYFVPDDMPDKKYDLFGSEMGKTLKKKLNVPVIGLLPFSIKSRELADKNIPAILNNENTEITQEFMKIARKVIQDISVLRFQKNKK